MHTLRKRAEFLRNRVAGAPRDALGWERAELYSIEWAIVNLEPIVREGRARKHGRHHEAGGSP